MLTQLSTYYGPHSTNFKFQVTFVDQEPNTKVGNEKICIIGGGPTGLTLGKELKEAGIEFDLFERESDFGGVWNASAGSGRVYESAHLISPKSITELADFPMPAHYPHYPNHRLVLQYWREIGRQFGVYEHAAFNTSVSQLEPKGDGWQVTLSSEDHRFYNLVLVCNGLQRIPNDPRSTIPGEFLGEMIHSMEYKGPDQIRGKRILVVGGGNSGCDIAVDGAHHAAATWHSTRRGYHFQPKFIAGKPTPEWMLTLGNKFTSKEESLAYMQEVFRLAGFDGTDYGLPAPDHPLDASHPIMNSQLLYHIGHGDIQPKGDVAAFDQQKVIFKDGSSQVIDLIIWATGYKRHFPFLAAHYLDWKNDIPDLFLHAVPRQWDNLLFLGFINTAAGFGSAIKVTANFTKAYIRARHAQSSGFQIFKERKNQDFPDVGQHYYSNTYRHLWEVDLWKYLKELNRYTDMLAQN